MQKNIYFLFLFIFPFTLYSEVKKDFASSVGTLSGFRNMGSDENGNILAMKKGLLLISPIGQIVRQITPDGLGHTFYPLKGTAVVLFSGKMEFYSTEKELTKLATVPWESCSPLVLKNGNIISAFRNGSSKILTSKGGIVYDTDIANSPSNCLTFSESANGTIATFTNKHIYFLTPQLHLIKKLEIDWDWKSFPPEQHGNLLVCPEKSGKINFVNSTGIKYSLKPNGDGSLVTYKSLPNGLTAFMLSDGFIYFLDAEGNKKYTHFHNTKFYSPLVVVDDKVLAYWNKTEIVFLDFQGNEIGTFEMNRPREKESDGWGSLIATGKGTVVALDNEGVLHFIKMN